MDEIESKVCTTCKELKRLCDYSPRKGRPLGVHYSCKVCLAKKAKIARVTKVYSEEEREVARVRAALWRQENPVRNKKIKSDWRKLNLHVKSAANARRRTAKIKRTPSWVTGDLLAQIENFYWLARDLKAITGEDYHVDHIIPLQGKTVCGLHVPWNLQVLPSDLNLKKRS